MFGTQNVHTTKKKGLRTRATRPIHRRLYNRYCWGSDSVDRSSMDSLTARGGQRSVAACVGWGPGSGRVTGIARADPAAGGEMRSTLTGRHLDRPLGLAWAPCGARVSGPLRGGRRRGTHGLLSRGTPWTLQDELPAACQRTRGEAGGRRG